MGWHFYRIWSTDWFRNKSVEKGKLLEAAYAATKGPLNVRYKTTVFEEKPEPEDTVYEETLLEQPIDFPKYKAVDVDMLSLRFLTDDFQSMILEILKEEAPLSEEYLLKRIAPFFGREKVTSFVTDEFNRKMKYC